MAKMAEEKDYVYLIVKPVLSSSCDSSLSFISTMVDGLSDPGPEPGDVSTPTERSGFWVCMPNFSLRSFTVQRCGLK